MAMNWQKTIRAAQAERNRERPDEQEEKRKIAAKQFQNILKFLGIDVYPSGDSWTSPDGYTFTLLECREAPYLKLTRASLPPQWTMNFSLLITYGAQEYVFSVETRPGDYEQVQEYWRALLADALDALEAEATRG